MLLKLTHIISDIEVPSNSVKPHNSDPPHGLEFDCNWEALLDWGAWPYIDPGFDICNMKLSNKVKNIWYPK